MTTATVEDGAKLRTRALAYLRGGAVHVLSARCDDQNVTTAVVARVQGHSRVLVVDYLDDEWTCTCASEPCGHLLAVQMVTGGAS